MQTWEQIRPAADEAIRAGLTIGEFQELQGISRDQWYRIKPKGFKWHHIQKKLGIKKKRIVKMKESVVKLAPALPQPKAPPKTRKKAKIVVIEVDQTSVGSVLSDIFG